MTKITIWYCGYRCDINGNLNARNRATRTPIFRKQTLSLYPHSGRDHKQPRFRFSTRVRCTTLCHKVGHWLATGRRFSPSTPVSSTNKTGHHDITEILIKVALSTIKQTNDGTICYVESGFLRHQNDAQQFMLMKQIGIYLPFPVFTWG